MKRKKRRYSNTKKVKKYETEGGSEMLRLQDQSRQGLTRGTLGMAVVKCGDHAQQYLTAEEDHDPFIIHISKYVCDKAVPSPTLSIEYDLVESASLHIDAQWYENKAQNVRPPSSQTFCSTSVSIVEGAKRTDIQSLRSRPPGSKTC